MPSAASSSAAGAQMSSLKVPVRPIFTVTGVSADALWAALLWAAEAAGAEGAEEPQPVRAEANTAAAARIKSCFFMVISS